MTSPRILFETPDGVRVPATLDTAKYTEKGKMFVWVRRHETGNITKAFATGEAA